MNTEFRRKRFSVVILALLALILTGTVTSRAQIDFGSSPQDVPAEAVVKVQVLLSRTAAEPGETVAAVAVVDIQPPWHVNSANPYQDWLIPARLSIDTTDLATPHSVAHPDGHDIFLLDTNMSVYSERVLIPFKVTIDSTAVDDVTVPLRFTYQPCDAKTCRAPEQTELFLTIPIGESGVVANEEFFVEATPEETTPTTPQPEVDNDLQRLIDEYGFWGYLIALGLAFVTGLLLSFSPCTYPMIPITVSIFAGQDRSVGRGFVLSLFYVGSMAMMYGIMGLIVSLVGGVFGAWLASTPVVIGIAAIFIVFALSMFGLYELQVPMALRQKLGTRRGGGGVAGAIVLGIVAALVVSPCVGPFVAGILLYVATSGSPVIGFLVLFTFALGLGTLFLVIGTFSSAIAKLPHSGDWMEQVKKFFGFVLIIMAIYFLRTIIPVTVTALATALVLLAFGVFGGGLDRLTAEVGFFGRLKKFLGVLALLIGAYLLIGLMLTEGFILPAASQWLPAGTSVQRQQEHLIPWSDDLQAGLDRARTENKPVIIDTWATWCANCRVLEKKTFGNPDVAREATRFVPLKVQLESANTEITKDFMKRFGLHQYSLPTVLLLTPDGKVARILQGVVEPDDMIAEMQKIH